MEKGIDGLDLCKMNETKLIKLVDDIISCQIPEEDSMESKALKEIVSTIQGHCQTNSCKKHKGSCRYGFPKLPSDRTILAKPICSKMDEKEKEILLEKAKNTLAKAMYILEDPEIDKNMQFEDFVSKIDKDLSVEDYIKHISINRKGKSIILKRDVKECFITNYNREMIIAWNANMDVQFALVPFAVKTGGYTSLS